MRPTVNYVLNCITEPFNARVIQKAQEQVFQRITVIPTSRSAGAKSSGLHMEFVPESTEHKELSHENSGGEGGSLILLSDCVIDIRAKFYWTMPSHGM